ARVSIEEAVPPVWEAMHVWLISDLVIFWTAFPHAFAAVMTTVALPLWLAVAGIVLRGAGFAFRKELSRLPQQRAAGATFAFSSLLTPFFMGTVVGAHRKRPDTRRRQPRQPVGLDERHVAADRAAVPRRLRLPGRRLPGRRGRPPRRPQAAALLHPARPGRRHHHRGTIAGHPGRTAYLEPGLVQPPHRPGARAGDHRRAVRPGRPHPADGLPPARHPGSGRAGRGRRDLGVGGGAVPGPAARHLNDADRRGGTARHPGRDHLAVRRRRPDRRAFLCAVVRLARPTGPAGRRRGNRLPRLAR